MKGREEIFVQIVNEKARKEYSYTLLKLRAPSNFWEMSCQTTQPHFQEDGTLRCVL